jgi:hypothetical protein
MPGGIIKGIIVRRVLQVPPKAEDPNPEEK